MTTGTPQPYDPRRPRGGPGTPRRSRARTLLPLAIACWALLEIWLLILLGELAGGLAVFLELVAGVVLGSVLIKRAGRRAWQRLTAELGAAPGAAAPQAAGRGGHALTMLGGLLLILPGLLSDLVGLLCVFPPTAALLRRFAGRRLSAGGGPVGDAYRQARSAEQQLRMRRQDGKVVPGEVVEDDPGSGGEERPEQGRS